jgi:putative acetyltransferase
MVPYWLINMQIRPERPEDAAAIGILANAAFKDVPYSDRTEAKIVEALRTAEALTISLVAVQDGEVVGHVAFSPVKINGVTSDWHGLGPVCVRPQQQGRGIGQALIRDGLHRLESAGAAGCVVLGDPAYYGRFGFEYDPELYYRDAPPGYFQRLTLSGSPPKGEVTYHPGFEAS